MKKRGLKKIRFGRRPNGKRRREQQKSRLAKFAAKFFRPLPSPHQAVGFQVSALSLSLSISSPILAYSSLVSSLDGGSGGGGGNSHFLASCHVVVAAACSQGNTSKWKKLILLLLLPAASEAAASALLLLLLRTAWRPSDK